MTHTQTQKPPRTRLIHLAQQLHAAADNARNQLLQPLAAGGWNDTGEWIPPETHEDRAYIALDQMLGDIVAALLGTCDGQVHTPEKMIHYMEIMARAQAPACDLPPSAVAVLECFARHEEQYSADTPTAAAQLDRLQWLMQIPEQEYLAALEETTDNKPRIIWSIHPDQWDFDNNCPKESNL